MKIAMIGARGIAAKYSGIETHLEELCPRLVERGHQVTVYARSYFTEQRDYRGVKIICLPTVRTKHFETLLHSLLATFHSLQSSNDIIHFHAQGPAVFSLLPRLRGQRTVVTVHGLDWQRDKWGTVATWCLRRAEQCSANFPNGVILVSRALYNYYVKNYDATKVYYIPNGVVVPTCMRPNLIGNLGLEPKQYILFVGRLTPEKACHHLLEAYQNLNTDMKLVIAGAPAHTDSYAKGLEKHATDKVLFLGSVNGDLLAELYSNAYLFVLPSLTEGLSISLLEAMSYGCCVLASDILPNAEVVDGSGFLFKVADVESLRDAIKCAIAEPEIVHQFGIRARKHVSVHYDWDKVAIKTEEVYHHVCGARHELALNRIDTA